MDSTSERGVAVTIDERLPTPPTTVLHYELGPVTYRQFQRHGQPWLAIYKAQHDGVGWLVTDAVCRPLVFLVGDHVLIRARVEEDRGEYVVLGFEDHHGGMAVKAISRKLIVFLEEQPGIPPPARVEPPR